MRTDVLARRYRNSVWSAPGGDSRAGEGGAHRARVREPTMPQVAKLGAAVTIWHQSGKGGQQTVQQAYADAGQPQHKVTEFIDDMAAA